MLTHFKNNDLSSLKGLNRFIISRKSHYFDQIHQFYQCIFKKINQGIIKKTAINEYVIKLVEGKQLFYSLIYSLGLIKFEIIQIYIKTILANSFIKFLKFSTYLYIFFVCKINYRHQLCIDFYSLNNIIIKN